MGCQEGYYLVNNLDGSQVCQLRTKLKSNANCYGFYNKDDDYCLDCLEGYYYNPQNNTCNSNEDCLFYTSSCLIKNPSKYYAVASYSTEISLAYVLISDYTRYIT